MNFRTTIQIILFILIFVIFYLFYFIYFKKDNLVNNEIDIEENIITNNELVQKNDLNNLENKEFKNIIEKIEYKSSDRKGNEYIVNAESGEISFDNRNLMKLKNVKGIIILINREPIYIYSNYAEYDTLSFDTKFYENVSILYEDNILNSDNFDLLIKDNIAKIYNNVILDNKLSNLNADIINIDLLNGDISVDMFDESKKIHVLKK